MDNNASAAPITILCQGNGFVPAPSLCVDSTVSFGSLLVGSTGLVQTVIITNCGTAALVISNTPVLTAGNTGDFIVVSSSCAMQSISTGSTCTVGLEFAPTAGGARSATLAITDNISGGPQLIALTGNGALSQPDAAIDKNTNLKKMVGFGVINTTGIGQEIIQNLHREATNAIAKAIEDNKGGVSFYVAVKNVGTGSDQFLVQGQQISGGQGFTANYFLGGIRSESVPVTAAIEAGTFATSTMEAGAVTGDATMIRVVIYADKTVAKGTTATFTLTFTSASDATKQDAVRATVVAK